MTKDHSHEQKRKEEKGGGQHEKQGLLAAVIQRQGRRAQVAASFECRWKHQGSRYVKIKLKNDLFSGLPVM